MEQIKRNVINPKDINKSIFSTNMNKKQEFSYCLVIPFSLKKDLKESMIRYIIPEIREKLKENWFFDEILIEKKDYKKLLKKSRDNWILNSLDDEYETE